MPWFVLKRNETFFEDEKSWLRKLKTHREISNTVIGNCIPRLTRDHDFSFLICWLLKFSHSVGIREIKQGLTLVLLMASPKLIPRILMIP